MIDRFLTRVGTFGLILILALAVLTTGLAGGAIEHFRLAAQHQQQGQQVDKGADTQSQQGEQVGQQDESQDNQNGTSAGQQGEQGDHGSGATTGGEGGD